MKFLRRRNKQKTDFEMECKDHTDYELTFVLMAENKLLEKMFNKAVKELKRRGKKVDADLKNIKEFPVDKKYFNLLRSILKKQIREATLQIAEDNIVLLTHNVIRGKFKRSGADKWIIKIVVGGTYVDKR